MRQLRKEIKSMRTSSLGRSSARLPLATSSNNSSNLFGGLGHQQNSQGRPRMASHKCTRAWVKHNLALPARLHKALFHKHQVVWAMCLRRLRAV